MRAYELLCGSLHGGHVQRRADPVTGVEGEGVVDPRI